MNNNYNQLKVNTIHSMEVYHAVEIDFSLYKDADPFKRLIAFIIDYTFIWIIVEFLMSVNRLMINNIYEMSFDFSFIQDLTFIVVFILYNILPLYHSGQTIGKKALSIRVIHSEKGGDISVYSLFMREIFGKFIFFTFLPLASVFLALDAKHQAIHDLIGQTRVIETKIDIND